MKLLVSIHDVSPAHSSAVQRIWSHCVSVGVRPALLVVPNWHGQWPLDDYRVFVDWVRDCERYAGAEVFLHGERHDEHETHRVIADELRAFGRTANEAEFLTLGYDRARARIARGLGMLRRVGLSPIGFVPPAWLAHRDCRSAVFDCGLGISEDAASVSLHNRGIRLESPVIRWSTRAPWRARASAIVATTARVRLRHSWLVRIALHPHDVDHAETWNSVRATLDHWLGRRRPWRYGAL
jgi:predicted deacetylase